MSENSVHSYNDWNSLVRDIYDELEYPPPEWTSAYKHYTMPFYIMIHVDTHICTYALHQLTMHTLE